MLRTPVRIARWWWSASSWPDRLIVLLLLVLGPANFLVAVADLFVAVDLGVVEMWLVAATVLVILPWSIYSLIRTEQMLRRIRRHLDEQEER